MEQGRWPDSLAGMLLDDFLERAEQYHGHISPGVVSGGFLVDAALRELGPTEYLNAVAETVVCLPDAVQILTGCTLGNGFMQVLDWGKFALTLYDRGNLKGVRAWLDPAKVRKNHKVADWFIRKSKEHNVAKEVVIKEILGCGADLVSLAVIKMKKPLKNTDKVLTGICPGCGESFPLRHGEVCRACSGQAYYEL